MIIEIIKTSILYLQMTMDEMFEIECVLDTVQEWEYFWLQLDIQYELVEIADDHQEQFSYQWHIWESIHTEAAPFIDRLMAQSGPRAPPQICDDNRVVSSIVTIESVVM